LREDGGAVARAAANIDHARRRLDGDASSEIDRRLRAFAGELQVLVAVPARHRISARRP
jgi:hypothetical protein